MSAFLLSLLLYSVSPTPLDTILTLNMFSHLNLPLCIINLTGYSQFSDPCIFFSFFLM